MLKTSGRLGHACNSSMWNTEEGGSRAEGQSCLLERWHTLSTKHCFTSTKTSKWRVCERRLMTSLWHTVAEGNLLWHDALMPWKSSMWQFYVEWIYFINVAFYFLSSFSAFKAFRSLLIYWFLWSQQLRCTKAHKIKVLSKRSPVLESIRLIY